jgi:hypothetical protein
MLFLVFAGDMCKQFFHYARKGVLIGVIILLRCILMVFPRETLAVIHDRLIDAVQRYDLIRDLQNDEIEKNDRRKIHVARKKLDGQAGDK